jgi:dATP pyrophosphohydrolase
MIKQSIECWLYHPPNDRFLLLRCPATSRHEEYWQPVTGGRIAGELPDAACVREVEEETGVKLVPEELELVIPRFSFCVPGTRLEIRKPVYLARVYSEQVVISEEHIAYCWCDSTEVESRLYWDTSRESFRQVLAYSRGVGMRK